MTKDEKKLLTEMIQQMREDPLLLQLRDELKIEPEQIPTLLMEFPGTFAYFGTQLAGASSAHDLAANALEQLEAEVEREIRKSPDFNPKATQSWIDSQVTLDERVQTLRKELIRARFIRDVWKIRLKSCEYSIESIFNIGHNNRAEMKNILQASTSSTPINGFRRA